MHVDFFGVASLDDVLVRVEAAYETALKGPLGQWFAGVRRRWRPSARVGPPGATVSAQAATEEQTTRALHEALDLPLKTLEKTGMRVLVVFDEFQDVLASDENADALIRSRIQHHADAASYVFAGSHPGLTAELFGSRERPLYGQARAVQLKPLADEDLALYVGGRFSRTGKDVGEALDSLLATVRGHPQRAMLLVHHLWEIVPAGGRGDEGLWERALENALLELSDGFEHMWEHFSVNERRTLAACAWIGPWGQGDSLFSNATLARFRLSKGTARDVRASLLTHGELMHDEHDKIIIVDPLFELWIASGRRAR